MSKTKTTLKIAGVMAASAIATSAVAAQNPFQVASLDKGYMVASADKTKEAKCGGKKDEKSKEAKCGATKPKLKDGKCGEGKCGGKM